MSKKKLCMHTCKPNLPDARDPKTEKRYFNGPYHGYFLSELEEVFNITSVYMCTQITIYHDIEIHLSFCLLILLGNGYT